LIAPLREDAHFNFFLLIDQFEELFRFSMNQNDVAKKDLAIDFVNTFLELTSQKDIPFYVVLTMRSDFIGDCSQFHGLPEAMNKSQYLVPRLNRLQLKKVIEGPANLFGGKFESSLTSRLLNHVGKVTDELPVLQHALMRMWEHDWRTGQSGSLNLKDYNEIGGIEEALSIHAEEALDEIDIDDRKFARRIFKGLTTIDNHGRKIRRPALLSELTAIANTNAEKLLAIIDHFVKENRSFLVVQNVGDTDDKLIDISHESLIRQWKTLEKWVEQEDENAKTYSKLIDAKKEFDSGDKGLLGDIELQKFVEWREHFERTEAWAKRYGGNFKECIEYLKNSELEQLQLKNTEKKRRKLMKVLTFSVIGLFLAIIVTGSILVNKNFEANLKELADRLNENASILLKEDPTKALLLEMAAYNVSSKQQYKDSANAIYNGNYSFYKIKKREKEISLAKSDDTLVRRLISPGHDKILAQYSSGTVRLLDMSGVEIIKVDSMEIGALAFSNDGSRFAIGEENGKITVWNDIDKKLLSYKIRENDTLGISSITFSHDNKRLVAGDIHGRISYWDSMGNWQATKDLSATTQYLVSLLKFSPNDSLLLASSYFNNAVFSETSQFDLTTEFSDFGSYDESGLLLSAAFHKNGKYVVTGGADRKVRLWKTQTNSSLILNGHSDDVNYVNFLYHENNTYIASASIDNTIILWDFYGNVIQEFVGHEDEIISVILSTDGSSIISESTDLTMREWVLWDGKRRQSLEEFLKSGKIETLSPKLKKEYGIN